jgi:hypothetical protein
LISRNSRYISCDILKMLVVVGIGAGGAEERHVVGVVGKMHALQHGLGEVGRNVEVLDGADQGVGAIRDALMKSTPSSQPCANFSTVPGLAAANLSLTTRMSAIR